MSYFQRCPRCGDPTLESLNTYAHCLNCNYNTVEGTPYNIPFHVRAIAKEKKASGKKKIQVEQGLRKQKRETFINENIKEVAL